MKTLVVVSLLIVAGCLCSVEAQKCLAYSSPVTLSGKLTSRIFPGPPNYTSIRRGDQKETAILLILPAAICTTGNDPEGIDVPESAGRPERNGHSSNPPGRHLHYRERSRGDRRAREWAARHSDRGYQRRGLA